MELGEVEVGVNDARVFRQNAGTKPEANLVILCINKDHINKTMIQ